MLNKIAPKIIETIPQIFNGDICSPIKKTVNNNVTTGYNEINIVEAPDELFPFRNIYNRTFAKMDRMVAVEVKAKLYPDHFKLEREEPFILKAMGM